MSSILGSDGKRRCFGGQKGKEFYAEYHDKEWGVPSYDDRHLFELLMLEGAQAGLSWETILRKRKAYKLAFHDFEPSKVASMYDQELEDLCRNPDIVRNRLKIYAIRKNADAFLKIQEEFKTFSHYLWNYVNGKPIKNDWQELEQVPAKNDLSIRLSVDLKKRGMIFVGPTIIYAYMQAVGLIDDHLIDCWRH